MNHAYETLYESAYFHINALIFAIVAYLVKYLVGQKNDSFFIAQFQILIFLFL